jgi:hypothetical protein
MRGRCEGHDTARLDGLRERTAPAPPERCSHATWLDWRERNAGEHDRMVMKRGLAGDNVGLSKQPAPRRPGHVVRRIGPVAPEA